MARESGTVSGRAGWGRYARLRRVVGKDKGDTDRDEDDGVTAVSSYAVRGFHETLLVWGLGLEFGSAE